MTRRWNGVWRRGLVGLVLASLVVPAAAMAGSPLGGGAGDEQFGVVSFPRDEHVHPDGWDFWWGAAHIVTESGDRYTLGIAHDSLNGVGVTGHELFPWQGPYRGSTVNSQDGPAEWGHEGEPLGRYARTMTAYVPGVSERFRYETRDTQDGNKLIGLWERTRLDDHSYRFVLDNDTARVHPSGDLVRLGVELEATMASPPLLAGGDGQFWYGIPEGLGYPSRSFQYMQAGTVSGTLELEAPDGSLVEEAVDPEASSLLMVHEYDASPEDLWLGLAWALSTQVHPRYPQYYQGGMPWELLFLDLDNGAQLMVAVIAFHDTDDGTLAPVLGPNMPKYTVLATLRLPSGESVPLDEDDFRVEHLAYRTMIGRVPTFWVTITGIWKQAWGYRLRFPGGEVAGPDGTVSVPPFDLGVDSPLGIDEPAVDDEGNGLRQRVPLRVGGSYGGCPVGGAGWSELIINWYGHEDDDPWFTGGPLPTPPEAC